MPLFCEKQNQPMRKNTADISSTNISFGHRVVNKLPETILNLLNDEQKQAFADALTVIRSQEWMDIHNVDVRYSIPLPKGRYYLPIISGPERRLTLEFIQTAKEVNGAFLEKFC